MTAISAMARCSQVAVRDGQPSAAEREAPAFKTNIVVFHLADGAPDAATVVARAKERDVLILAFGPRTIRAVTHLDVSREDCSRAAEALAEGIEGEAA